MLVVSLLYVLLSHWYNTNIFFSKLKHIKKLKDTAGERAELIIFEFVTETSRAMICQAM